MASRIGVFISGFIRAGRMEKLSSRAFRGSEWCSMPATVAIRSVRQIVRSQRVPDRMRPGQRAINGMRRPPSQMSAF